MAMLLFNYDSGNYPQIQFMANEEILARNETNKTIILLANQNLFEEHGNPTNTVIIEPTTTEPTTIRFTTPSNGETYRSQVNKREATEAGETNEMSGTSMGTWEVSGT